MGIQRQIQKRERDRRQLLRSLLVLALLVVLLPLPWAVGRVYFGVRLRAALRDLRREDSPPVMNPAAVDANGPTALPVGNPVGSPPYVVRGIPSSARGLFRLWKDSLPEVEKCERLLDAVEAVAKASGWRESDEYPWGWGPTKQEHRAGDQGLLARCLSRRARRRSNLPLTGLSERYAPEEWAVETLVDLTDLPDESLEFLFQEMALTDMLGPRYGFIMAIAGWSVRWDSSLCEGGRMLEALGYGEHLLLRLATACSERDRPDVAVRLLVKYLELAEFTPARLQYMKALLKDGHDCIPWDMPLRDNLERGIISAITDAEDLNRLATAYRRLEDSASLWWSLQGLR